MMGKMFGSDLIREARLRADLSQGELAGRAGTTQSAIARLESGRSSPGFERVLELVAACGLELRVSIREPSRPSEPVRPEVPAALLRPFLGSGTRFVLTGGFAARLHGGPDSDPPASLAICPDDGLANMEALCRVLDELAARLRIPDGTGTLPLDRTPNELLTRGLWSVATIEGDLDVVLRPPGTRGYRDLVRDATTVVVDGLELPIASLPDVVRELEAASADPDLVHALRRVRRR
jgi:transcriptional regulator with XRE-family HTH domain